MNINVIKEGREIFDAELKAISLVRDNLGVNFVNIFNEIINCKGKVIFTGIGKPGHIATKIAATFSSLGIPSFYLHPSEAQHGDLGMIQPVDLVVAISFSGESTEVLRIIPNIKLIGAKIIGITGNGSSSLAKKCDLVEVFPHFEEAGYLKLAPTSSTTVTLVYFDALSIAISKYKGFDKKDFGLFHPAGSLGKKLLLKVKDLMVSGDDNAIIIQNSSFQEAIIEMCKKPLGLISVVDDENHLLGVISDGDIRRALLAGKKNSDTVNDVMTKTPQIIGAEEMAVDALALMVDKRIQCLPVLNDGCVVGTIQIKDILNEGIYL